MKEVRARFTVFFEDPFWVGIYERTEERTYEAAKITFGPEPKDYEVYAYLREHWPDLCFSPLLEAEESPIRRQSHQRMKRTAERELRASGAGTKAQQALKLRHEQEKAARRVAARRRSEAEKERRFACRQVRKKEKHRGR